MYIKNILQNMCLKCHTKQNLFIMRNFETIKNMTGISIIQLSSDGQVSIVSYKVN